jgi:hypothetical protein
MIDLTHTRPTAIKAGFGNTIFYYGVEPNGLSELPTRSEFTLVYSPSQEYGWEAVLYRVLHSDKTYFVVNRRDLQTYEIEHFEQLLREAPPGVSDRSCNDQMGTFLVGAPQLTRWVEACATSVLYHLGLLPVSASLN